MDDKELNRGKPTNRERMKQIIRFDGLRYDNPPRKDITPTDIDMALEKNDQKYVYAEFKHAETGCECWQMFGAGQKYLLKNIVDNVARNGRDAVLFLCRHDVHDCNKDVYAKDAKVTKIYFRGKWTPPQDRTFAPNEERTLKDWCDRFMSWEESANDRL